MLTRTSQFSLASSNDADPPVSQLVNQDSQSVAVRGKSLEAQFATPTGQSLLILTDDCPFEETVRVILLSAELVIVDELEFASAYESLIVQTVNARSKDMIDVQCDNQRRLQISLHEQPLGAFARLTAIFTKRWISKNNLISLSAHSA